MFPDHWASPEHLHVALNHVPLIGGAAAALPLLVGLVAGCRTTVLAGLFLAVVACGSVALVMSTGERAEERLHSVHADLVDEGGMAAMETHEARAHLWSKLTYAVAGIAGVGVVAALLFRRAVRPIAAVVLLACIANTAALVWVAASGGEIRHPEFRPPQADADAGAVD